MAYFSIASTESVSYSIITPLPRVGFLESSLNQISCAIVVSVKRLRSHVLLARQSGFQKLSFDSDRVWTCPWPVKSPYESTANNNHSKLSKVVKIAFMPNLASNTMSECVALPRGRGVYRSRYPFTYTNGRLI